MLNKILANVLTALYQPFWFSVLFAATAMFALLYVKEHGGKESIRIWMNKFRETSYFRRIFFLVFYTMMILFRTLLNRNMWANPLSNVMDGWWIYNNNGELTTECIENVMLMIPFTALFMWAKNEKLFCSKGIEQNARIDEKKVKIATVLWQSVKITFIFSTCIEFLQLFLRLGTFQLSDIFYNTLGGFIGGLLYWIMWRAKHKREHSIGAVGNSQD